MSTIMLEPSLWLLDPPELLERDHDFAWDAEHNTVRRLSGGSVPPGSTVIALQPIEVIGALITALAAGAQVTLPAAPLRVWAQLPDTESAPLDLSDLSWRFTSEQSLASEPAAFTLSGPEALREALEELEDPAHTLIAVRALIGGEFELPLAEGFLEEIAQAADDHGRVIITATFRDPLSRLQPPAVALEDRRWGRILQRQATTKQVRESPGFVITDLTESITDTTLPTAHGILRDIFRRIAGDWFTELVLGMLDFPVVELDGRGLAPLAIFQELARLAGAQVVAEGRLLIVRELGPASRATRADFIYPQAAITTLASREAQHEVATRVQLFGHAETGLQPGLNRAPIDPSQPGYVRLGETEGVMEPLEPVRSHTPPAPLWITFRFNATLYDPATLLIDGATWISGPTYELVGGTLWATIVLELPWVVTDLSGDPPFELDEHGEPRFVLAGQIVDALSLAAGDPEPVPHAQVTRTRLVGEEPTTDETTILADGTGYYRFTDVPLARWRIRAIAPGYRDNWSDTDPDNDLIRDLEAEYADWLGIEEEGRFRTEPTTYHVIVWARARMAAGPVQDLTLGQVRVEVRAAGVAPEAFRLAPAIRDERLTTERLAIRVGQIVLWASAQTALAQEFTAAPNPLLLPGDRLTLRDAAGEEVRFDCARVQRIRDTKSHIQQDQVSALDPALARAILPRVLEDPLETRIGLVVGRQRNASGQLLVDVEIEGVVLPGLGINPLLGELFVGEVVQVAKWFPGAVNRLVVARAAAQFGTWRIAEVAVE